MAEIKTEAGAGSGKGGQYLGEDLARDVTLSPDLIALAGAGGAAGAALNDVELEKLITERLRAGTVDSDVSSSARDLAEVIVDALPPSLHTADIGQKIDLRPYLHALDGKTIVSRRFEDRGYGENIFEAPSAIFGSGEAASTAVAKTQTFFDNENKVMTEHFNLLQDSVGTPAEDRQRLIDKVLKFTPGKAAGIVPDAVPEAGVAVTGGTVAEGAFATVTSEIAAAPVFSRAIMRQLVTNDQESLDQLVFDEGKIVDGPDGTTQQYLEGGKFPIDLGPGVRPNRAAKDWSRIDPMDPSDSMGAFEALNYLQTLSRTEISDLQDKLANAGYFDRVGADGSGASTFLRGDAHDPETKKAWRALLTESISKDKSTVNILVDSGRSYRRDVQAARMRNLTRADPDYTKAAADEYAQSAVGRSLTANEQGQLNDFLGRLISSRAGYVSGARNEADQPLPNDLGFTGADVQGFVDKNTMKEQRLREQNEQLFRLAGS